MTEVCYDEMGASAPLGVVGGMVERRPSEIQEKRNRWALAEALHLAHICAVMPEVSVIESWAIRFAIFADTGSFDAGDSK